jgi:hypothetical protein
MNCSGRKYKKGISRSDRKEDAQKSRGIFGGWKLQWKIVEGGGNAKTPLTMRPLLIIANYVYCSSADGP